MTLLLLRDGRPSPATRTNQSMRNGRACWFEDDQEHVVAFSRYRSHLQASLSTRAMSKRRGAQSSDAIEHITTVPTAR